MMIRFVDWPGIVATPFAEVRPLFSSDARLMLTFSLSSRPALAALPITCWRNQPSLPPSMKPGALPRGDARLEFRRVPRPLEGCDPPAGPFPPQPRCDSLLRRSEERRFRSDVHDG